MVVPLEVAAPLDVASPPEVAAPPEVLPPDEDEEPLLSSSSPHAITTAPITKSPTKIRFMEDD